MTDRRLSQEENGEFRTLLRELLAGRFKSQSALSAALDWNQSALSSFLQGHQGTSERYWRRAQALPLGPEAPCLTPEVVPTFEDFLADTLDVAFDAGKHTLRAALGLREILKQHPLLLAGDPQPVAEMRLWLSALTTLQKTGTPMTLVNLIRQLTQTSLES
jgi:hypothetical protein